MHRTPVGCKLQKRELDTLGAWSIWTTIAWGLEEGAFAVGVAEKFEQHLGKKDCMLAFDGLRAGRSSQGCVLRSPEFRRPLCGTFFLIRSSPFWLKPCWLKSCSKDSGL